MARHGRRRSRRYGRNPMVRFFNGLPGGGIVKKLTSTVKETVSVGNAKKAGAVLGAVAAGFFLPAKFLPQYDQGLGGILLTVGGGILATIGVGFAAPSLVPLGIVGSLVGGGLKAGFQYARNVFYPTPQSLSGFLTRGGTMGQIPAGLLAPGQLHGFLEATRPFAAMGPTSALTLGGGERFSNVV